MAKTRASRGIPARIRAILNERIRDAEKRLARLGVVAGAWRGLVPFVRVFASGVVVELRSVEEKALERVLGPRFQPLDEPIGAPDPKEIEEEENWLTAHFMPVARRHPDPKALVGVGAVAEVRLMQQRMREQDRDPMLERYYPKWELAEEAAVAFKLLEHGHFGPEHLEYFERLDVARGPKGPRRRGGQAPKKLPGIAEIARQLVGKGTARALWERIPAADDEPRVIQAGGYEVYRARKPEGEEVLCQVNGPGPDAEIKFVTWRGYLKRARQNA